MKLNSTFVMSKICGFCPVVSDLSSVLGQVGLQPNEMFMNVKRNQTRFQFHVS